MSRLMFSSCLPCQGHKRSLCKRQQLSRSTSIRCILASDLSHHRTFGRTGTHKRNVISFSSYMANIPRLIFLQELILRYCFLSDPNLSWKWTYLKETRPVGNHSNDEIESVEYIIWFASVLSEFVVSPTVMAYVVFQTPECLYLTYNHGVFLYSLYIHRQTKSSMINGCHRSFPHLTS